MCKVGVQWGTVPPDTAERIFEGSGTFRKVCSIDWNTACSLRMLEMVNFLEVTVEFMDVFGVYWGLFGRLRG